MPNPDPFASAFNIQFGSGGAPGVTARDMIQDALEMLHVYSPGETANPPDMARGLSVLNDMLDSWSNESLTCFAFCTQEFMLVVGKHTYTVGPGGDINGPRPLRVIDAPGSAYLLDANNNRYPMNVDDQLTWNITTTAVVDSDLPDHMLYQPEFPLGIIKIWPTPAIGYRCFFTSYQQLTDFRTLEAAVGFPPGYKLAITANLAIALKPYFKDAALDPIIVQRASESKANIKRTNMRTQLSIYDPEIIARGSSTYNIFRDSGSGRM